MNATKKLLTSILMTALILGCSSEKNSDTKNGSQSDNSVVAIPAPKQSPIEYTPSDYTYDLSGKPVTVAGITFTPAIEWEDLGASDMRVASYKFGPLEQDTLPAELAVYYFGAGQGGSIEANQQRWIKQMAMPDGRDPATAAIRNSMQVQGMSAQILTLYGIFNEPVGGMMSGKTIARPNYRLIGIIVEAPKGNVFFKLTGPDFTARIMVEALIPMIEKITKE